jgi:hypothetical protein
MTKIVSPEGGSFCISYGGFFIRYTDKFGTTVTKISYTRGCPLCQCCYGESGGSGGCDFRWNTTGQYLVTNL